MTETLVAPVFTATDAENPTVTIITIDDKN